MNEFNYDIKREGISHNQFEFIYGLLDTYTYDAQYLENEQDIKRFNNDLNILYRSLKSLIKEG